MEILFFFFNGKLKNELVWSWARRPGLQVMYVFCISPFIKMDMILFIPLELILYVSSFVERFGPDAVLGNFYMLFDSQNSSPSLITSLMPVSGL